MESVKNRHLVVFHIPLDVQVRVYREDVRLKKMRAFLDEIFKNEILEPQVKIQAQVYTNFPIAYHEGNRAACCNWLKP